MKKVIMLSIVLYAGLSFKNISAQSSHNNTPSSSSSKDEVFSKCACNDGSTTYCGRSDLSLLDLIPNNNSKNSTIIEVNPSHDMDYKKFIDYYKYEILQNQEIIASVTGSESEEGAYQNLAEVCKRTSSSKLEKVYNEQFGSKYNFIVSKITGENNQTSYTCNFSLVNYFKSNWRLESHWNLEAYSKGNATFNFQISALTAKHLHDIINDFVAHFSKTIHLTNHTMGKAPTVFAKTVAYSNKTISIKLANPLGLKSLSLQGVLRRSEISRPEVFERHVKLSGVIEEVIEIDIDGIYDISLHLTEDSNEHFISDRFYLADGKWSLNNPQASAILHKYEISQNLGWNSNNDFYLIERNLSIKGRIKRNISLTKQLDMYDRPIDFSAFNSFDFIASGNVTIDVVLVSNEIEDWDQQIRSTIDLTENSSLYRLSKAQFDAEDEDWKAISKIVFVVKGSGVYIPLNLEISELRFTKQNQVIPSKVKEEQVLILPNPLISTSRVRFESPREMTYQFQLWSLKGELLQSLNGRASVGSNDILISQKGLAAGNYISRFITSDGRVLASRLIVL